MNPCFRNEVISAAYYSLFTKKSVKKDKKSQIREFFVFFLKIGEKLESLIGTF